MRRAIYVALHCSRPLPISHLGLLHLVSPAATGGARHSPCSACGPGDSLGTVEWGDAPVSSRARYYIDCRPLSTRPHLAYLIPWLTSPCAAMPLTPPYRPPLPPSAQSSWRTVAPSVRLCRWAAPGFVRLLRRRPRSSRLSLLLHKHLPGCALCCSPMLLRRIRLQHGARSPSR